MTLMKRAPLLAAWMVMAALPAAAGFNASDLILVPIVAHNEGSEDSVWRSDVYITNVEPEASVDVMMVFVESGLYDNSYLFEASEPRQYWLGGREEEGFGMVEEALADIPPNATVVLEDVVGEYFSEMIGSTGGGGLIVFAYEAGTLDAADGRVPRNVVVNSRTYSLGTIWEPDEDNDGEFLEVEATYGQNIPGVPWYNLVDAGAVSEETGDFSYEILTGGVHNDNFRYNVGVFNASDLQTTLTVRIKPYQPDGQPYVDEDTENEISVIATLPPLAHVQYNQIIPLSFGLDDVSQVRLEVGIVGFSTNSINPVPMLKSYGSVVDNRSNDPSTVLPSFEKPYNVDCMWPSDPGDGEPAAELAGLPRPFDVPPRSTH